MIKISHSNWFNSNLNQGVQEVVEAVEVIEAAEVLRPGKSPLRTSESSRHLNSFSFLCFEKQFLSVES